MRIAILRRPEGLFELEVERVTPFAPPGPTAGLDQVGEYVERVRALDVGEYWFGDIVRAADARLREVTAPDGEVLAAALHVLINSVPDPGAFKQLAMPRLEPEAEPPRRTAANPRGFRGTKRQPPKPARTRPYDARPYLDGGNQEAAFLAQLAGQLAAAAPGLLEATYGDVLIARGAAGLRPYAQSWEPEVAERLAAQPASLRRCLLWPIRGMAWEHIASLIASYWALDLERDTTLRRMIAAVMARGPFATTVAWIRAVEGVAGRRRLAFVELLLETNVILMTGEPDVELLQRAEALCDDACYRHRLHHLFAVLAARCPAEYALDGFAVANRYRPDGVFCRHDGAPTGTQPALQAAMAVIGESDDPWAKSTFGFALWEWCGRLDGLAPLLASLPWERLDPETAFRFAEMMGSMVYADLDDDDRDAKWACVRDHAPALLDLLASVAPAYRGKAGRYLREGCWWWDRVDELATALGRYHAVIPRLCAAPFSTEPAGGEVMARLMELGDAAWTSLVAAPDASFERLERACRRDNDERLICNGLQTLARRRTALVTAGFSSAPNAVLATAKTLGALAEPARDTLLSGIGESALFRASPEELALEALVALLDGSGSPAAASLVSSKARQHLRDGGGLGEAQVARARQQIVDGWDLVRLTAIEAAVEAAAARVVGVAAPSSSRERHALLLLMSVSEHRRGLRKLLRAHFRGDRDYLDAHPASQAWLRAHPSIDAARWTAGLLWRRDLPGHGEVTFAIERDPLEVLRLGTYVGSCLGLGGGMAFSAVAITLDVNKQVVYARDRAGGVIARQVLALSERDRLFCFEIYPLSASDELKALFREYDRAFAAALGVAVLDPEAEGEAEDGDDIAHVLSKDWWFDDVIRV